MEEFDLIPVIKELIYGYKQLSEDVAEMKSMIMDNLISPINEAYEKEARDNALSDFRCKYAEKLEPFNDRLKSIEGEDFDIIEKAFEDFSKRDDDMTSDDYVEALSSKVSSQLESIGKAFGIEPEEIKEVSVETKDGEEKTVEVETISEAEEVETVSKNETVEDAPETKERPEGSTDTPDDEKENYKYWEELLGKNAR